MGNGKLAIEARRKRDAIVLVLCLLTHFPCAYAPKFPQGLLHWRFGDLRSVPGYDRLASVPVGGRVFGQVHTVKNALDRTQGFLLTSLPVGTHDYAISTAVQTESAHWSPNLKSRAAEVKDRDFGPRESPHPGCSQQSDGFFVGSRSQRLFPRGHLLRDSMKKWVGTRSNASKWSYQEIELGSISPQSTHKVLFRRYPSTWSEHGGNGLYTAGAPASSGARNNNMLS